jgi:hypothetical protein
MRMHVSCTGRAMQHAAAASSRPWHDYAHAVLSTAAMQRGLHTIAGLSGTYVIFLHGLWQRCICPGAAACSSRICGA